MKPSLFCFLRWLPLNWNTSGHSKRAHLIILLSRRSSYSFQERLCVFSQCLWVQKDWQDIQTCLLWYGWSQKAFGKFRICHFTIELSLLHRKEFFDVLKSFPQLLLVSWRHFTWSLVLPPFVSKRSSSDDSCWLDWLWDYWLAARLACLKWCGMKDSFFLI